MQILDWKALAQKIKDQLKSRIEKNCLKLKLAIIFVWDSDASKVYIKNKISSCDYVWIEVEFIHLDESCTQNELIDTVHKLNNDKTVTWIIVQAPIPKHLYFPDVVRAIDPKKDVDWFTAYNVWKMVASTDFEDLPPATPAWIIRLLNEYDIMLEWMNAVVVGHSNIVWKPMSIMLLNRNATVSTCHIYTKDLRSYTLNADLIISAAWVPKLITADMVKEGVCIVDVWINRDEYWNLCWDVDFENVKQKCSFISPVPWWVWPMTIAQLLLNIEKAGERR